MSLDEIIIFDATPVDEFRKIANQAVRYALISVAFTYDRLGSGNMMSRIENITKGKIAEGLFYYYCDQSNIDINTAPCNTPYWMPDLRDFLWLGGEWDIKNNYFFCSDDDFSAFRLDRLPALIPDNYPGDQWSKRNHHKHTTSRFNAMLFTFMRYTTKHRKFFNIDINDPQKQYLAAFGSKAKESPLSRLHLMEQDFYHELDKLGGSEFVRLHYYPEFIITGCANANYWHAFECADKETVNLGTTNGMQYANDYKQQGDYISYLDGALVTKIRNQYCPVIHLPSFRSVVDKHKKLG
ncbi:MAG: hypothetical protein WAU01_17510 [Saprospiraceae bacterium]